MNKNIIIVDIDGTISNVGDRLKYLECKDWDSFFEACDQDEPILEIIEIIKYMRAKYQIYFCTARPEYTRKKTFDWINKHVGFAATHRILMRADDDFRHDAEVKPELVRDAGIDFDDILFVLEDRVSMVAKWRELGVNCLQVADGNF